ncbi:type II secretion system protein [Candidatus Dependentiae bacterium]|nr:type II secretion system protein [Candidatus Dependentiae bacterium]
MKLKNIIVSKNSNVRYFQSGFTLIELLVVIIILGLLSTSALTAYQYFYSKYKLKNCSKTLVDTIFYAGYYSNFFKKKTAVKLFYKNKNLYADVISYESDYDTKLINNLLIGENISINPVNNGNNNNLPEIYFNKNFAISGKASLLYPSYYVSDSGMGKIIPLILLTLNPISDPLLKNNKQKYVTLQFFEESGKTILMPYGFENNTYFKN